MQSEFPGVRRVVGALAFVFLSACSGGGDNGSSRQLSLSTTSLTFSANAPSAATPESQVITANFGEGVANVAALHTGPAIDHVDVVINGSSAQITVVPSAPPALGAGAFKGTIAVTGYFCADPSCSRLEAGGTQTVNASYQVSPVVGDVAPNVAISGNAGNVVIRGVGFQGFSVQGVSFGTTAATSITIVNDGEIRATHPALPAGSYPVTLDIPTHIGAITTNATLTVIDPVTHSPQALAWPSAITAVHSLEYDARRGAVLAATNGEGGRLVRYAYENDAWQAPAIATIANLRDAALSIDGSQWAALTISGITPLDPVTLVAGTAVAAPSLPNSTELKSLGMLNSNIAIVTTGIEASQSTPLYAYNVRGGELVQLGTSLNNATARGAANGSLLAIVQGDPSLTTPPSVFVAGASGAVAATTITLNQNPAIPPALDRDASRIVLNGTRVYDGSYALLGTLPDTTSAVAVRPDGKRAYTYDAGVNGVRVFDISETKSGEAYAAIGDPITLVAPPGAGIKMTISADGNTLFIAGATQLVVQPTPAL